MKFKSIKTETLKILNLRIIEIEILISNAEKRLSDIKLNPIDYLLSDESDCRHWISEFNNQKRQTLDCIDWVKSIGKQDLKTHRTK